MPVYPDNDPASRIYKYMVDQGNYFARLPGYLNVVYLEGADREGHPNADMPNQFNDRRMVLTIKEDRPVIIGNWEATTEPGKHFTYNPMDRKGTARIAPGQFRAWSVGWYKTYYALKQVSPVKVYRDLNQDS